MSAVRAGRVVKNRGRRPKKSVLRMMAIMTDGNKEEVPKEFIETGRTGRRNAMPDILHSDANVTTADLPARLERLATSGESQDEGIQSSSAPPSISVSYASVNSDVILKNFLDSTLSSRRHGISHIGSFHFTKEQAAVASISENELKEFLQSGCSQRRDALPQIQCNVVRDDKYKNVRTRSIGTAVSDTSFKYCCSEECLQDFLNSALSKRRHAVPCVKVPKPNKSIMVDPNDLVHGSQDQDISRGDDPKLTRVTEVIQLDTQKLLEMLSDPNNPQPGPSNSGQRSGDDEAQKGS